MRYERILWTQHMLAGTGGSSERGAALEQRLPSSRTAQAPIVAFEGQGRVWHCPPGVGSRLQLMQRM